LWIQWKGVAIVQEAKDLIGQLTLEEKASLCSGLNDHFTKPVERLGIPSIEVSDGPHGLRHQIGDDVLAREKATCFPSDVAIASSWNPDAARRMGEAIGKECKAAGVSVILGPAMNIKRTPLCGRNFEYFSEDPYLSGTMAAAYAIGAQSQGVGACLKHFAANNQEHLRMCIDSVIDERALREIYLKGFEIAVKTAKPACVMAAYNKINGVFCTENKRLLTEILRNEWGFQGIAMSDWGAVNVREDGIRAGLDLEMPSSYGYGDSRIVEAVKEGRLSEGELDEAVLRILQFVKKSYENLNDCSEGIGIDPEAQHDLARDIAKECIVLLKNEDGILPLNSAPLNSLPNPDAKLKKLAVIGAMAKHPRYQGGGSSNVSVRQFDIPYDEILKLSKGVYDVAYAEGYEAEANDAFFSLALPVDPSSAPDGKRIAEAVELAKQSDVAIVFAGLPEAIESEGVDRPDMKLPKGQAELLEAVLDAQPMSVVVLNNGSPVEMEWADKAKAIVEGYVGGEGGAYALAQILFGKVNPSAKLAETFPVKYADTPAVAQLCSDKRQTVYTEGIMVGYRYYDAKELAPRFPFGHGLSYTAFEYSNMVLSKVSMTDGETLAASVDVTNTGEIYGAEVVQFYVSLPGSRVLRPKQELKAFSKVWLSPNETKTVTVELDSEAFSRYDTGKATWVVDEGAYVVKAAASSRDIRLSAVVDIRSANPQAPVFDLNTSIGEITSYTKARAALLAFLTPFIASSFLAQLPGTDEEIALQMLQRFDDMPLRSLTLTGNQSKGVNLIRVWGCGQPIHMDVHIFVSGSVLHRHCNGASGFRWHHDALRQDI
jgi:beta-glucosidase